MSQPMVSAADPLAGLKGWHLPEPVSWWPPAPGWWVLIGLLLVLGWVAARRWVAWRRGTAPARAALAELARLRAGAAARQDPRAFAAAVSGLLRRFALARWPREEVAGLAGEAWLAFLDRAGGGGAFAAGPGRALVQAPYRPVPLERGRLAPDWDWGRRAPSGTVGETPTVPVSGETPLLPVSAPTGAAAPGGGPQAAPGPLDPVALASLAERWIRTQRGVRWRSGP